jgi:hypothetical protein
MKPPSTANARSTGARQALNGDHLIDKKHTRISPRGNTTGEGKRTGLPLRSENDLDTGDADQQHLSIRYDYANVQPPTGVK